MNKVYELKYNNIINLENDIKKISKSSKEEDFYSPNNNYIDIFKRFINSKYDIKVKSGTYITVKEDLICFYLSNPTAKSLICKIDNKANVSYTKLGIKKFSNPFVREFIKYELYLDIKITLILEELCRENKIKFITGKFNNKLKLKNLKTDVLFYPETNAEDFCIIKESLNKIDLMLNNHSKLIKTVPSKEYPMPNNSQIKIFTKQNTEDINIKNIDSILENQNFQMGFCYTNTDKICELLTTLKDSHNIEFYSGWLLTLGNMVHHAWVVIDGKHIIDTSVFKKEEEKQKIIDDEELGIPHAINKNIIAKETVKLMAEEIPFSEKYQCGKIINENIYIGVKSNSNEARISFNNLMDKMPNHKDYKTINPDGSNETLNLIMKYSNNN